MGLVFRWRVKPGASISLQLYKEYDDNITFEVRRGTTCPGEHSFSTGDIRNYPGKEKVRNINHDDYTEIPAFRDAFLEDADILRNDSFCGKAAYWEPDCVSLVALSGGSLKSKVLPIIEVLLTSIRLHAAAGAKGGAWRWSTRKGARAQD